MPRPRKPTRLKLLQGNAGKRRLPKNEPQPVPGCDPPAWVTANAGAKAEWERLAPRLTRLGILSELDGPALALLCVHLATAGEMMQAGQPVPRRLSAEIRCFLGLFGMSPGDRSKVTTMSPPGPPDPFSEWKAPSGGWKG